MTTPKRPETVADLPESDRTEEVVRIAWPSATHLLDRPEALGDLTRARSLLVSAHQILHGDEVEIHQTDSSFSIRRPATLAQLEVWLHIRQQAWDREHALDDTKVGGSE